MFSSFSFSVLLLFISPKFFLLFLGKGSSLTRSICHFLVHFLVVIFVFEVIPPTSPTKSPRIAKQYQSAQDISLDIATERSFPFWGGYSIIDIPFFIWDSICRFRVSFGKTRRKKFKHQAPYFELWTQEKENDVDARPTLRPAMIFLGLELSLQATSWSQLGDWD